MIPNFCISDAFCRRGRAFRTRIGLVVLLAGSVLVTPSALSAADASSPARDRIDALVRPLLEGERVAGLVIGLVQPADAKERFVDESGIAIFGYGRRGMPPAAEVAKIADESARAEATSAAATAAANTPPDADTLFEIGSVTKPITGLLLADMVERGEVALDEPVSKLLPDDVKVPSYEGREITLLDLATHTSGLPRLPSNLVPANPADPYADYTRDKMLAYLSTYELRRAPGEKSVYSNYGMGLLGEALALRAKSDYASLLRDRILAPLGMSETRVELDSTSVKRLAPGHDVDVQPLVNWDLAAFVGAGGIRSTARDMVRFVQANLYLPSGATTPGTPSAGLPEIPDSLRRALALSQLPRHKLEQPPGEIALAWVIQPDGQTVWHNGQTGGYHSFVVFDRARGIGVVVLSNTAGEAGDDLGLRLMKLLAGENPDPPRVQKQAKIDPALLAGHAGRYSLEKDLGAGTVMTIVDENGRLWAKLSVQPRLGIYPESETEFFYKAVDAQITFTKDDAGKTTGLVLHQNGKDFAGVRIEDK